MGERSMARLAERCYDEVANRHGGRFPSLDEVIACMDAQAGDLYEVDIRQRGLRYYAEREDQRRLRKGNKIVRPSTQLTLEGRPEWLADDAFLPTMDGGRYRAATGVMADWPVILAEADREAESGNRIRAEKYGAFNELVPYLSQGQTNDRAWESYRRDRG